MVLVAVLFMNLWFLVFTRRRLGVSSKNRKKLLLKLVRMVVRSIGRFVILVRKKWLSDRLVSRPVNMD